MRILDYAGLPMKNGLDASQCGETDYGSAQGEVTAGTPQREAAAASVGAMQPRKLGGLRCQNKN